MGGCSSHPRRTTTARSSAARATLPLLRSPRGGQRASVGLAGWPAIVPPQAALAGRNQPRDFRVHRACREARFPCSAPPVQPRQVSWRSCPFRAVATERRSFSHRCRGYRFSPWLRCQETRSSSRGEEFPQATRLPPSELLMVRIDAPSVRCGRFGMPSLH